MPPLVNLPSQLYLSDTDPPFLYQYVGNQMRIIQILGNNTLNKNINNETTNPDQWDQTEAIFEDSCSIIDSLDSGNIKDISVNISESPQNNDLSIKQYPDTEVTEQIYDQSKQNTMQSEVVVETAVKDTIEENNTEKSDYSNDTKDSGDNILNEAKTDEVKLQEYVEASRKVVKDTDDPIDTINADTSLYDNDSADSDDEASFGTPENSPKTKRKSPKGKYGKGKAPSPPKPTTNENEFVDKSDVFDVKDTTDPGKILEEVSGNTTSQESLSDIVNSLPNTDIKESGSFKGLQVVNPIAEKKRRHKSKSPGRIPKGSNSGLGKLLQLPSKLAFWNKSDNKSKDNVSTSSGDRSRRSSTFERTIDEFQSCPDLNDLTSVSKSYITKADDQISFKDATDIEDEGISQNIMEKSDALQKLIDAKLESHPEYKIVSLHEEIPTTSKSTEV